MVLVYNKGILSKDGELRQVFFPLISVKIGRKREKWTEIGLLRLKSNVHDSHIQQR